ncbi:MAG: radical SAM protein [Syntrophorhabdaceae bacterium]|nr:radical SAM protein [Syntrophorhabdaceae bacterium]
MDASVEGIHYLLNKPLKATDKWTSKAFRGLKNALQRIKDPSTYLNIDTYRRAVKDINRVVEKSVESDRIKVSLGDYTDKRLSPLSINDLLYAARHFQENPFYPYFSKRLSGFLQHNGKLLFGFSINYLSQVLTAFAMMGFLKNVNPTVEIIAGGGLITSWMKRYKGLRCFQGVIDHMVPGPGEIPLLNMVGVKPERAFYTPSFNNFPWDSYLSPGYVVPYNTSTGCYWRRCRFCPEVAERTGYQQITKDEVREDLSKLRGEINPALFHITDNAISPNMLLSLTKNRIDTPWYGFVRPTKELTDTAFLEALKRSGCVMLKLGIESGSQDVLDMMNKGCDIKTISYVLKALHNAGIGTYVYLLFGTPWETEDKARETLDFVVEHERFIDFLNLAIFNLPVNSGEAEGIYTDDFYEGDLTLYKDFKHPKGWGRKEVRSFLDNVFKKEPSIRGILKRHPFFFSSNHAPFFVIHSRKGNVL